MPVNLVPYLRFVRTQGGEGCWGYALNAVWDILNELACPNCPNMSMNLGLMLHRRRDLWQKQPDGSFLYQTPDGRYHKISDEAWVFGGSFGNSTEGTEPTNPTGRWTGGHTIEGCNEAHNYRLKGKPSKIIISSQSFRNELDKQHPIRIIAGGGAWGEREGHVVAIIGYDEVQRTFTFVDSANYADRTGFGTLAFDDVDRQKFLGADIQHAEIWEVIPPRPVPTAIIRIIHKASRMNVNLWLSVEGSPHPKRKIWPAWEWPEEDRQELNFKVRLPAEIIWPPSPSNRVVLDLYDSGTVMGGGGEIVELNAAYGAHVVNCVEVLNHGPISFNAGEHRRFYIPQ